ncbi:MAG: zinc ribbon domain-containing protein [Treponema sp.]|nr:zinc ribbon domain-containing protein [Treponema sp.]
MPTYEYECKSCSHNFEVFQSMSDEPLKVCPQCGKEIRRLIFGGTGVIFKGSGFYITDKSKSGSKSAATIGGDTSSQTAAKTEKKPETAASAVSSSPCAECPKKGAAAGNTTGGSEKCPA